MRRFIWLSVLVSILVLHVLPAAAVCPGDCDGSGTVDVSKLIRGVNIALGNATLDQCAAFDVNGDGSVAVNELIAAVNAALSGCPIEPIFPANYRDTFTEVRDCRFSVEHGAVMIRVLANDIGAGPYLRQENPLPVGSIIVKEEYDADDCSDPATLVRWRPMRKEAPGFDSADGDWSWQWVDAPARTVRYNDKATCIGCHRVDACLRRDYMCTEAGDSPRGVLHKVLERQPAALLSISGTSPTDVFAVGADAKDGHGPYVVHYDGSGWTRLDSGASGDLWWISVTPIDGAFYMVGSGGLVLQLDPLSLKFTQLATPGTATMFGIWGAAGGDLWAVGGDDESQGVLWHYDGQTWVAVDISGLIPDGVPTLYKIWGRSASDIYVVGDIGTILHYDGLQWSVLASPIAQTLFTVHGNADSVATVGGFFTGVLLEEQTALNFQPRSLPGAAQLNGVFVPPSGQSVAVGNGLTVAVRDGAGWSIADPGNDDQTRDFHAVWVDSDDGIWAVGGDLSLSLTNGVLSYGGPQQVVGGPVH